MVTSCESSIVIVVVEMIRRMRYRRSLSRQRLPIQQQDVLPAIAIEINDCHTTARRLDDVRLGIRLAIHIQHA